MSKRWIVMLFVVCLLAALACSCGPSQAELDPEATEIAASFFATETALASMQAVVSATDTPLPTHTPVPTDTPVPPANTPTPTHTPLPPTETPIPPTPTATVPPATPTRVLEPVTVVIDWSEEVRRATVDAHRPVIAQWRWLVCQPQVVQQWLDTLTFEVTIDGRLTDTGSMAQHREGVREENLYGRRWWVLYWSYPMGAFESGSFHWLEVEYHVIRSVTSGCDLDADGHLDMVEAGWQGVTRLELTVQ